MTGFSCVNVFWQTISEYDQDMPQSHTTDQSMAPRVTVKNDIKNTRKVKQPTHFLSLFANKLERSQSAAKQNKERTLNPHKNGSNNKNG